MKYNGIIKNLMEVTMRKMPMIIILCLFISGCATTINKTNRLSMGMTKQEVMKVMGQPSSSKGRDNVEVLEYTVYPNALVAGGTLFQEQYWVILENGKVKQYGRAGDFGSAEKSDITIENKY